MLTLRNVDVERARLAVADNPDRYKLQDIPNEQIGRSKHFIAIGMTEISAEARANGDWSLPNNRILFFSTTKPDECAINMTRVPGTDGTSNESLTHAEFEARSQIEPIVKLLRKYIPGFENAILASTAHQIGIRETRRILGDYVLTGEDVLKAHRFPDEVMLAGYMVDIHHPFDNDGTFIQAAGAYGVPYRCLVPKKVENLLVAGRSISTTHEGQSAIRVMPPCMAMGEAAGCAAAMASRDRIPPRRVDVQVLRAKLRSQGVCLDV
jgi:hypothetical protein